MKYVVTGSGSGLGKYLCEEYGNNAFGVTRDTDLRQRWDHCASADVLIHSAFKSCHKLTTDNIYDYVQDNIYLTDTRATVLGHAEKSKFIYPSTIAVYDKNFGRAGTEEDIIDLDQVEGTYGRVKLMAEAIVKKRCDNYLILRLPSILGKYMRNNSFVKAVTGQSPLALTPDSMNNYVTYEFVKKFIDYAVDNDLRGIYNVVARNYLDMSNICRMFGNTPEFGMHYYCPPAASNKKLVELDSSFDVSSEQAVKEFADKWAKSVR